jgi:dGTPase
MEEMPQSERNDTWVSTMSGNSALSGITLAHTDSWAGIGTTDVADRITRESTEDSTMAPLATRAVGPGNRVRPEEEDPYRTCFERDRDRILHASSFCLPR